MAFGRIVTGHLLDCNPRHIERALQLYDQYLYIKWNPDKRDGMGVWEVRRRPTKLSTEFQGFWNDGELHILERRENDYVHHVLDVERLDWRLPDKIRSMDTWQHKDWVSHMEEGGEKWMIAQEKAIREDMLYNIKQHKKEFKDFAEMVAQGMNPGRVLSGFTPKGFESQDKE